MKQVSSIICYVFAGWMLATSSLFCFINVEQLTPGVPALAFLGLTLGMTLLPGLLALLIGLRLAPDKNWQRDVGATLCGGTGVSLLIAFNLFTMLQNPKVREELPNLAETYGNLPLGTAYLAVFGVLGGLLLYRGLYQNDADDQQPEAAAIIDSPANS